MNMTRRLLFLPLLLLATVTLLGRNQQQPSLVDSLYLRRRATATATDVAAADAEKTGARFSKSILDVNLVLFNAPSTDASESNPQQAESTKDASPTVVKSDERKHPDISNTIPSSSSQDISQSILSSAKNAVAKNEARSVMAASTFHDPVLSTLAEKRPCGIVPAVIKTVSPTWLASYPASGSQETWRLVQAVTGLMTDEDVTNHGHALAGKAVLVKTHFPSHTPADAFEKFQSQLLIQKAVLNIRNPIHAIPAYHKFLYAQEINTNVAELHQRVPVEHWIQWRNTNFELELTRWVDQIRWWTSNYQQARFDKLLLIPYERLMSTTDGTGVDELWKLAFFLRSVDRSIVDSMIPMENFQCLWDFVLGPQAIKEEQETAEAAGTVHSDPLFTAPQLQLIHSALVEMREEYTTSYHELASVAQSYLIDVERLISTSAETTPTAR
jgi:hypothetical protein